MKNFATLIAITLAVVFTASAMAGPIAPPTPLLKYEMQDTTVGANRAANTGSLGTSVNATLVHVSGAWTDQKENRNLSSLKPGPPNIAWRQSGGTVGGAGPRFLPGNADIDALDELESFTVAGWIWTNGQPLSGTQAGRVYHDTDGSAGIDLRGNGAESLQLQVDTHTYSLATGPYTSSTSPSSTTTGWFFFAVTWDGSDASQPASYYIGRPDEALGGVSLVLQDTLSDAVTDLGKVDANTAKPSIFNESGGQRALSGWLDDFAFWGAKDGGTGALNIDQLEGYRRETMGFVIPEPTTLGLLGLGGLAMLRRRK